MPTIPRALHRPLALAARIIIVVSLAALLAPLVRVTFDAVRQLDPAGQTQLAVTLVALYIASRIYTLLHPYRAAQRWSPPIADALREDVIDMRTVPGTGAEAAAIQHANARHEAAHVVVAHALGGTVQHLQAGLSDGHAQSEFDLSGPPEDSIWRLLPSRLAGHVIDTQNGIHNVGSHVDIQNALTLAAAILSTGNRPHRYDGMLTSDALITAASQQAREILARNSAAVDAITQALSQPPFALTGQQARTLLQDVPRQPTD